MGEAETAAGTNNVGTPTIDPAGIKDALREALENDIRELRDAKPGELARRLIERGWRRETASVHIHDLRCTVCGQSTEAVREPAIREPEWTLCREPDLREHEGRDALLEPSGFNAGSDDPSGDRTEVAGLVREVLRLPAVYDSGNKAAILDHIDDLTYLAARLASTDKP